MASLLKLSIDFIILPTTILCEMDIKELQGKVIKFRDARDWKQFNTPKDVAISLTLESSEVLEHFQWKSSEEVEKYLKVSKEEIGEELADVLWYLLTLSNDIGIDISKH